MRKKLILFFVALAMACIPCCLFGTPKVSSLANTLVEMGYTPITLKRADNEFFVSCKVNGHPADLVVDTGAATTFIDSAMLKSFGVSLTRGEEKFYGAMGFAGKGKGGDVKDLQVGPYQAGANPVRAWGVSHSRSGVRGPRMDGLLGIDFLHRHQAVIDCFRMHLFLKSPSASSSSAALHAGLKAGGCIEIPMRHAAHHGLTVPAQINGRSGYMTMDTGSSLTFLSQRAISGLNMHLVSATRFNTRLGMVAGGGAAEVNKAHFTTMNIGSFSVPTQSLAVVDLPHSKDSGTGDVFFGYLGHDLLACYVGIIDCATLKLFMRVDPVIDAARRRRSD